MPQLQMVLLELVATLATGLFTGASIYVSLVEHPSRLRSSLDVALAQFAPSHKRAAVMQSILAIIGSLAAAGAWQMGADKTWFAAAIFLVLVIPFTLIVILPANRKLLRAGLDQDPDQARRLLRRWGRLHALRSLLSFLSFLLCVASLKSG